MAAKNDILKDKDGNQIFPATTAEQVSYDGEINVKQAIKRGAVRNKVAPTVASMTDKEQIYVYTGTEDGYTFGNWYYWNGTAWTSGGAYNAIEVNTDETLTEEGAPADAKATGDKLTQLKDDLVDHVKESQKAIEDLNDKKITKFYTNSLGEKTLNDSDHGKIQDMMMYGKSEQKSYSGKNLFKAKNEGIITVTDDGLLLNGTTDSHQFINFTIHAGSYFMGEMNGNSSIHSYIDKFDSYMTEVGAITFETDKMLSFYILQGTYSNILIKPYIVEGSNPMETYEPYVGGIPSPNPDYPQEIQSVVNPVVKVRGKNFYSGSDLIGLTEAYTTDFIPVILRNGKIWFSFDVFSDTSDGNYFVSVEYFDANKEKVGSNGKADLVGNNISHINFNFDESIAGNNSEALDFKIVLYVKVKFYIYAATATEITYKNIMISDTDSDYEPYKPIQTATLPYTLNAIPVSSGGNVTIDGQQYIADYVDVENKKLVRMVGEVDLGALSFVHEDISFRSALPNLKYLNSNTPIYALCEKYYAVSFNATWDTTGMMSRDDSERIVFINKEISDVSEFVNSVSGIKLIYALETPTITNLTDEEVKVFKDLSTYYGTTNIINSSDQLDGFTTFNYPVSLKNGWEYVKQQIGDTREYIYDMELQSAEAYVNSEYAVTLTELEV